MVRYILGLAPLLCVQTLTPKPVVPILGHIQVLQELKHRFEKTVQQVPNIQTQLTPTQAHIAAVNAGGLEGGWSDSSYYKTNVLNGQKDYKEIVDLAMQREKEYCGTHYVFYHGQNQVFRVFQDFLKELYTLVSIHAPLQQFEFFAHVAQSGKNVQGAGIY